MHRNIPGHAVMNFVPHLSKEHPVFRGVCNFFNIGPIHIITEAIISHLFLNAREVLLVYRRIVCYNKREKAGEIMIIGIIGAGASGMAAALAAAEYENVQVLLFERQALGGNYRPPVMVAAI